MEQSRLGVNHEMYKMQIYRSNQSGKNDSTNTKAALAVSLLSALLCIGYLNIVSASPYEDQMIIDYCVQHAETIALGLGFNPIDDLVKSGLVSPSYANQTCSEVKIQSEINQSFLETMDELIVVP